MYFFFEVKIGVNVNVYFGMVWFNFVFLLKFIIKKELVVFKYVY